jgi:hypothetical protein
LRYATRLEQLPGQRLAVRPDALFQRARQLGLVRLAHQVAGLVVERGVEEEAVVLDLEVAMLFADAALAQREELLTLGEGAHSHSPLFQSNRHRRGTTSDPRSETAVGR